MDLREVHFNNVVAKVETLAEAITNVAYSLIERHATQNTKISGTR